MDSCYGAQFKLTVDPHYGIKKKFRALTRTQQGLGCSRGRNPRPSRFRPGHHRSTGTSSSTTAAPAKYCKEFLARRWLQRRGPELSTRAAGQPLKVQRCVPS